MSEQQTVWVFIEQRDGHIAEVSLELVGRARELADRLGCSVALHSRPGRGSVFRVSFRA